MSPALALPLRRAPPTPGPGAVPIPSHPLPVPPQKYKPSLAQQHGEEDRDGGSRALPGCFPLAVPGKGQEGGSPGTKHRTLHLLPVALCVHPGSVLEGSGRGSGQNFCLHEAEMEPIPKWKKVSLGATVLAYLRHRFQPQHCKRENKNRNRKKERKEHSFLRLQCPQTAALAWGPGPAPLGLTF